MEHLSINLIRHFVETHALIGYFLTFLGVVLEGEVAVIFAGIFSHLSSFNIFIALFSIICGGVTKSIIGYTLGAYLRKNHSDTLFLRSLERRIAYFFPNFSKRPFLSIFISRFFILGMAWFTLIYSGYKKVSLRIYARAEALSLVIWSVGVLALGYFFSYTALSISRDIRNFIGLILIFFILFFMLEKIIAFVFELFETTFANNGDKNIEN
jgi:membrane protein DedA with SNARE-associated domain